MCECVLLCESNNRQPTHKTLRGCCVTHLNRGHHPSKASAMDVSHSNTRDKSCKYSPRRKRPGGQRSAEDQKHSSHGRPTLPKYYLADISRHGSAAADTGVDGSGWDTVARQQPWTSPNWGEPRPHTPHPDYKLC